MHSMDSASLNFVTGSTLRLLPVLCYLLIQACFHALQEYSWGFALDRFDKFLVMHFKAPKNARMPRAPQRSYS